MPCEDTDQQGEWHVMMKAEIGMVCLSTSQGTLRTIGNTEAKRKGWSISSPTAFRKRMAPVNKLISDF